MKAVILAAGKSTRTYPLTLNIPKVLLKVAGKPLLQHNLELLKGLFSKVILVVGFKEEMIRETLGEEFLGIKIVYINQKDQLGTGHALLSAEKHLNQGRFIVMNGDDIYSRDDLEGVIKEGSSLLAHEVQDPQRFTATS